ncbi:LON peptidase substrate-binding domain-containing protein [Amycolatopsis suaedae]|uniref:LON peptidase substrate-binding domain-containing protein n=1 Tax=Amycolatopsis suaedae TaxID=2510978 RepID=UPI0013EF0A33|nr:LON peptidase substrate-binding domain-containing protein [Amycolatopsis suaedae]
MTDPAAGEKEAGTQFLPLFPLQTVLLPGAHLPLHIFEPRYRQLTMDLVTGAVPQRQFGVVALRGGLLGEVDTVEQVFDVGCTARLRDVSRLPDGRFDVIAAGQRRFRLLDVDTTAAPYLMGTIEWCDDDPIPPGCAEAAEKLAAMARTAHRRYCAAAWASEDWSPPAPETPVRELAYLLAADGLLPLEDRQALLEQRQPLRRLREACELLSREAGFLAELRAVPVQPGQLTLPSGRASMN